MTKLTFGDLCSYCTNEHEICNHLHPDIPLEGFCCDSRSIIPGQVYVAIEGARVDGHNYVNEAFKNNALLAIVKKDFKSSNSNFPLIRVDNPIQALQHFAKQHLTKCRAKVLAITGSLGKTSTKDFTYEFLKSTYRTKKSLANHNSQIGLALTLLNQIEREDEIAVLEMAMTEYGQIQKLVSIAPPFLACVSHIAHVHVERFGGLEGIARAKSEIFSNPATQYGIVNQDAPHCDMLTSSGACQKRTFSKDLKSDAYWKYEITDTHFKVYEGAICSEYVKLSNFPEHQYQNVLLAIAIARTMGVSFKSINEAYNTLQLSSMRLQREVLRGITFFNDAYNAAELSMKGALSYIKAQTCSGRKFAVLGQMPELGVFSEQAHRNVAMHALECVDFLVCLGKDCASMVQVWKEHQRDAICFSDFSELVQYSKNSFAPTDMVLLKGKNTLQLWRLLEYFKDDILHN